MTKQAHHDFRQSDMGLQEDDDHPPMWWDPYGRSDHLRMTWMNDVLPEAVTGCLDQRHRVIRTSGSSGGSSSTFDVDSLVALPIPGMDLSSTWTSPYMVVLDLPAVQKIGG